MLTKYITERQLKNAIKWFVAMHSWEFTNKALRKTERVTKILNGYVYGEIKLRRESR